MKYADFIRSLPCSVCDDDTVVQQHHLIDLEFVDKGLALKVDEILSIPLCPTHHGHLHCNLEAFTVAYGSQEAHLCKTLLKARIAGWEFTDAS